ncbi:MAG: hypothetical protein Q4F98_02425 [Lachnospiraceae bacterium]|nr:hypothetical protein [Lachnospiraceae bacterium]
MDMELENEIRKVLRRYHKKKWIAGAIVILDIAFFVYLYVFKLNTDVCIWAFGNMGAFFMQAFIFIGYMAIAIGAGLLIAFTNMEMQKILFETCDPFLYEACILRTRQIFFKDRVKCNLAVSRYYQGNIEKAYATLMEIRPGKLKKEFLINYYLILSAVYFEKGMGDKVPELEKTCKRRMANNKKGQKLFWYLCASNNLQRAIVNKDYEAAFKFLNEAEEQRTKYNYRIYKLFYCYYSALIYMGVGDKKSAKWNLDYVIQTGNCLSVKEKAEEMRKSMEESEI